MKFCPYVLLFLSCFVYYSPASGQANFREGWEATNPVGKQSTLSFDEKIKAHQAFWDKAITEGNVLRQLYGQLYLAYDYLDVQDYPSATDYLLKAEAIAQKAGNPGWLGWVVHRKAIVSLRLHKDEEARKLYEQAAKLCGEAGDSLCVAESFDQISVTDGRLNDFKHAERYHAMAMQLLKKYGDDLQLASSLNNYGNTNSWAGRHAQAIPHYINAIALYKKIGKTQDMARAMNNYADVLRYLHRYDESEKMLEECLKVNRENNFEENLMINYANLSVLHDSMKDYRAAFLYLHEFHFLKDSLIGAETQRKIAEMQIKYETQQKELELEKSNLALAAAQRIIERGIAIFTIALILITVALWRWRLSVRQNKQELEVNLENLTNLTRLLMDKNKQLSKLRESPGEEAIEKTPATKVEDFESNLYNQHILTDADWTSFKIYFEKAHPKYLQRLRTFFPVLTDAEERLFLLIKLNLNTKEVATILGIAVESVKKTRNRLRKKLELGEGLSLEDFIRNF